MHYRASSPVAGGQSAQFGLIEQAQPQERALASQPTAKGDLPRNSHSLSVYIFYAKTTQFCNISIFLRYAVISITLLLQVMFIRFLILVIIIYFHFTSTSKSNITPFMIYYLSLRCSIFVSSTILNIMQLN